MRKKLTVIVVPEVERKVRRFRTSRLAILIIALSLLSSLAAAYVWLRSAKLTYDGTIVQLQNRLSDEILSHHDELIARDETIEELQQEIIQLTMQTEEVRERLGELRRLEDEIQALTGVSLPDLKDEDALPVQAAGGSFHPPEPEDILKLAGDTESSLQELSRSLTQMSERLALLIEELEQMQYLASITPSIRPAAGRINSGYGYRLDPFTRRSAFHSGIDIDGKRNDPIYATAAGTVVETGRTSELGNYIIIDHSLGIRTLYAHLNEILVEEKARIDKGDRIGRMGSTGRSTGTHLHYEVHKNGNPVDPLDYIED